jgi:hypothetical protein
MIRLFPSLLLALCLWGSETSAQDSYYGSATYTPQQLHELLVGQNRSTVLQAFGRMPNIIRGHDWFYENVAIYVPERDQYYTLAVVCFSQADGRVWQVVCYPH